MITLLNSAIYEPSEGSIWNIVIWLIVIIAIIIHFTNDRDNKNSNSNINIK